MKNTIYTVVGVVVLVLAIAGGYMFPRVTTIIKAGGVSTSGTYNNSQGLSQITFTPSTATSTAILNTGASDRVVTELWANCQGIASAYTYGTGAGLASWTLQVSTNQSGTQTLGSTSVMFNGVIATSSTSYLIASSTGSIQTAAAFGSLAGTSVTWPVNTYLVFQFNATDTASCSLASEWFAL